MPNIELLVWFVVIHELLSHLLRFVIDHLIQIAAAAVCVVVAFRIALRFRWFWRAVYWLMRKPEHFFEHIVAWLIRKSPK